MNIRSLNSSFTPYSTLPNKKNNLNKNFKGVNYEPVAEEVKKIYKNGLDIYLTTYRVMRKINSKYDDLIDFLVRVDISREPRIIRVNAEIKNKNYEKMLSRIAEGRKEDDLPEALVQLAKEVKKGGFATPKEEMAKTEAMSFITTEAPVFRINFIPHGHGEKRAQFMKDLEEGLSLKNILVRLNKENHGKSDFTAKTGWLERIFG